MTDLRKAAEMALNAMLDIPMAERPKAQVQAIQALRQALAQPEQEPVARMNDYNACKCPDNESRCFSDRVFRMMQKYTAPTTQPEQRPVGTYEG